MRIKDDTSHYLTQGRQNLGVEKARYPGVDAVSLLSIIHEIERLGIHGTAVISVADVSTRF
jgi:hypothetical protein